jgi:hypothetical protein
MTLDSGLYFAGVGDYVVGKNVYQKVPRIFVNLFENVPNIIETILQTSAFELSEYWETKTTDKTKLSDLIYLIQNTQRKYKMRNI